MSEPVRADQQQLSEEGHPVLAMALRAVVPTVIQRWRDAVREALPQADDLTLKALDNSVPRLLEELAEAIHSSSRAPAARLAKDAPAHGETRFHQQFNLDELMIEYHLLRHALFEELAGRLGRMLSREEAASVNAGVDLALRRAVVAYTDHLSAQIRGETESMAKYLSFLSHELRGAVNGAVIMSEVLRRTLQKERRTDSAVEDLEMMRRSMLETVSMMERFLHAERLRSGRMVCRPADVRPRDLITRAVRDAQYQLRGGTTVESRVSEDVPVAIRTDGELLRIVLNSLLTNAIKYGEGKPVSIQIAHESSGGAARPPQLKFSVIDAGPGIPAEVIPTLFTSFQRGETHGKPGTGLGLAIAHEAARLLGASIRVESTVGRGSSFHLELPLDGA